MKTRWTSQEALDLIASGRGLIRTLFSDAEGYDFLEHWDFLLDQLQDPENNRPIRPLATGADRSQRLNMYTGQFETRLISNPHRGRSKPGVETIKAISATLLPTDGRMNLYNCSKEGLKHENVAILFDTGIETDPKKSIVKECFVEDAGTNTKFWVQGQPLNHYHQGQYPTAVSLDELRQHNEKFRQQLVAGQARRPYERNEVRIKPRKRDVFAVAALKDSLKDRLNAIFRKILVMEKLIHDKDQRFDVPILIIDTNGARDYHPDPSKIELEQIKDLLKGIISKEAFAFILIDKLFSLSFQHPLTEKLKEAVSAFESFTLMRAETLELTDLDHFMDLYLKYSAHFDQKLLLEQEEKNLQDQVIQKALTKDQYLFHKAKSHAARLKTFHEDKQIQNAAQTRIAWTELVSEMDEINERFILNHRPNQNIDIDFKNTSKNFSERQAAKKRYDEELAKGRAILSEKIQDRLQKNGIQGGLKKLVDQMVLTLQNDNALIMAFKANEWFASPMHNTLSLKAINVKEFFGKTKTMDANYMKTRDEGENSVFSHLSPKTQKAIQDNHSLRPRYAGLRLRRGKQIATPLNRWGKSYFVFQSCIALNSLFVPKNAFSYPNDKMMPCTFHHFEILLYQASISFLKAFANNIQMKDPNDDFLLSLHSNDVPQAYLPPLNLFDRSVVEYISVHPDEYAMSASEKQMIFTLSQFPPIGNSEGNQDQFVKMFLNIFMKDNLKRFKESMNIRHLQHLLDQNPVKMALKYGASQIYRFLLATLQENQARKINLYHLNGLQEASFEELITNIPMRLYYRFIDLFLKLSEDKFSQNMTLVVGSLLGAIENLDLSACNLLIALLTKYPNTKSRCQNAKVTCIKKDKLTYSEPIPTTKRSFRGLSLSALSRLSESEWETLYPGAHLVVQDPGNSWLQAYVKRVNRINHSVTTIEIHYCGWSDGYDEVLHSSDLSRIQKHPDLPCAKSQPPETIQKDISTAVIDSFLLHSNPLILDRLLQMQISQTDLLLQPILSSKIKTQIDLLPVLISHKIPISSHLQANELTDTLTQLMSLGKLEIAHALLESYPDLQVKSRINIKSDNTQNFVNTYAHLLSLGSFTSELLPLLKHPKLLALFHRMDRVTTIDVLHTLSALDPSVFESAFLESVLANQDLANDFIPSYFSKHRLAIQVEIILVFSKVISTITQAKTLDLLMNSAGLSPELFQILSMYLDSASDETYAKIIFDSLAILKNPKATLELVLEKPYLASQYRNAQGVYAIHAYLVLLRDTIKPTTGTTLDPKLFEALLLNYTEPNLSQNLNQTSAMVWAAQTPYHKELIPLFLSRYTYDVFSLEKTIEALGTRSELFPELYLKYLQATPSLLFLLNHLLKIDEKCLSQLFNLTIKLSMKQIAEAIIWMTKHTLSTKHFETEILNKISLCSPNEIDLLIMEILKHPDPALKIPSDIQKMLFSKADWTKAKSRLQQAQLSLLAAMASTKPNYLNDLLSMQLTVNQDKAWDPIFLMVLTLPKSPIVDQFIYLAENELKQLKNTLRPAHGSSLHLLIQHYPERTLLIERLIDPNEKQCNDVLDESTLSLALRSGSHHPVLFPLLLNKASFTPNQLIYAANLTAELGLPQRFTLAIHQKGTELATDREEILSHVLLCFRRPNVSFDIQKAILKNQYAKVHLRTEFSLEIQEALIRLLSAGKIADFLEFFEYLKAESWDKECLASETFKGKILEEAYKLSNDVLFPLFISLDNLGLVFSTATIIEKTKIKFDDVFSNKSAQKLLQAWDDFLLANQQHMSAEQIQSFYRIVYDHANSLNFALSFTAKSKMDDLNFALKSPISFDSIYSIFASEYVIFSARQASETQEVLKIEERILRFQKGNSSLEADIADAAHIVSEMNILEPKHFILHFQILARVKDYISHLQYYASHHKDPHRHPHLFEKYLLAVRGHIQTDFILAKLDKNLYQDREILNLRIAVSNLIDQLVYQAENPKPKTKPCFNQEDINEIVKSYHQHKWHWFGEKKWAIKQSQASHQMLLDLNDITLSGEEKYTRALAFTHEQHNTTLARVLNRKINGVSYTDLETAKKTYEQGFKNRIRSSWLKQSLPVSPESLDTLEKLRLAKNNLERYQIIYDYVYEHPEKQLAKVLNRIGLKR